MTDIDGKIFMHYNFDKSVKNNPSPSIPKTPIVGDEPPLPDDKRLPPDVINSTGITQSGIDIQTHGYIYHPNFLKLDVGGGPVYVRNVKYEQPCSIQDDPIDGQENSPPIDPYSNCGQDLSEPTYNLNVRLSFLEQKHYPISLYYDRRNPFVVPRIGDSFLQESTKYGLKSTYRGTYVPITLNLDVYRLTLKGEGSKLIIDDDLSQINLRVFQNDLHDGHRELAVQASTQISHTGSISQETPVESVPGSDIDARSLNYNSRTVMGAGKDIALRNSLSYLKQKIVGGARTGFTPEPDPAVEPDPGAEPVVEADPGPELITQIQYRTDLQWNHTKSIYSFYRLDYLSLDQNTQKATNSSVNFGYADLDSNFGSSTITFSASTDRQQNKDTLDEDFRLDVLGMNGSLDYSKELGSQKRVAVKPGEFEKRRDKKKIKGPPIATFRVHFGLGYHVYDRLAKKEATTKVINESHVYGGEGRDFEVGLNHEFIDTSTVVVKPDGQEAAYIKGTDYIIEVIGIIETINGLNIGKLTNIRRLVGGAIGPTQAIRVNYSYQAGSTFSHNSFEQQLQMSLEYRDFLNVFAGVSRNDISLTSGDDGNRLHSIEILNIGFTTDMTLHNSLVVGADLRFDQERKSLAPNDRITFDSYVQSRVFTTGSMRVGLQQINVDYINISNNLNNDNIIYNNVNKNDNSKLTRITTSWSGRPFPRASMSMSLVVEKDRGTRNPRSSADIRFKLLWVFRQLKFEFDARYGRQKLEKESGIELPTITDTSLVRVKIDRRF